MTIPSKSHIFEHWKDWLNINGFDWGEPCCWACKKWWGDKYDIKNPEASWDEIKAIWNKVPLQRCHIIPRSLGGTNDVSNLFLICTECHDLAPNTTSREAFLLWASKQNWLERRNREIADAFNTYEIKENDCEELLQILQSNEFNKWFGNNVGLHLSQYNGGSKITISSIIAALLEYKNQL